MTGRGAIAGAMLAALSAAAMARAQFPPPPDGVDWKAKLALGRQLQSEGRLEDAEDAFVAALKTAERFGASDPRLGASLNALALLYHTRGLDATAEPLYKRAIEALDSALGPAHPDLAKVLGSLAALYLGSQRTDAARPVAERRLDIVERTGGDPTDVLGQLALIAFLDGDLETALRHQSRVVDILEAAAPPSPAALAEARGSMGVILAAQGRYAEAAPAIEAALTGRGGEELAGARDLGHLAEAYADRVHFAEAETALRDSIRARRQILGPVHAEIATALNNLGELLRLQAAPAEAEPLFREAHEMWLALAGGDHLESAISGFNLATALVDLKRFSEAAAIFDGSVRTLTSRLGPANPKTEQAVRALEEAKRLARTATAEAAGPGGANP